jgi:hypothetical protein
VAADLERALRLEGMEDVVVWIGDGSSMPRPAADRQVGLEFSVTVAAEYQGHWSMLSRVAGPEERARRAAARFSSLLEDLAASPYEGRIVVHELSGADSFRAIPPGSRPGRRIDRRPPRRGTGGPPALSRRHLPAHTGIASQPIVIQCVIA